MELNMQEVKETFGSAPAEQKGKKFIGVDFQLPIKGQIFFSSSHWSAAEVDFNQKRYPVAIFEDTHRPDGTPMDIAELLQYDGFSTKYYHVDDLPKDLNYDGWDCIVGGGVWSGDKGSLGAIVKGHKHYVLLFKIAKPTTIEDLVGEGSKIVWLHWFSSKAINETAAAQVLVKIDSNGLRVDGQSIAQLKAQEYRWSHSHTTSFSDANEFTA